MSVSDYQATSPFALAELFTEDGPEPAAPTVGEALLTPFSESMTAYDETGLEAETAEALLAEFEDEEFDEALDALTDEAAARHLRSVGTWTQESEVPVLATAETEQWMESVATKADGALAELEAHFADRPADSLRDGEMEAVVGLGEWESLGFVSPLDAQELFFKKLLKKAKKVVRGVAKIAKKGIRAVGSLTAGRLFGLLRRVVRPILKRVLAKAIGRLPAPLRPLAKRLAKRFTGEAEATDEASTGLDGVDESTGLAFDHQVAELILAPSEAELEQSLGEFESQAGDGAGYGGPLHDLDVARARLARELAEATPGEPPTAQMERFVPAVMAAMPLIRTGIRIVGRKRAINFVAAALANLIKGTVGAQAAKTLSRHIADAGFKLLGLEAESGADPTLGTEALVAAAEDTVRDVMSLPQESLEDELVLEAEIQEAFADAAARHLPATVLRAELAEGESEAEQGLWVSMPRATRPLFRYKKYSRVVPVLIRRQVARSTVMPEGETLEQRLLDAGATSWPVNGEMELYELLEGAELGHVAAFENAETDDYAAAATTEFEELSEAAATALAGNPRLAATGRRGRPGKPRRGGTRYYRLRVGGRAVRRRAPFALRLDLSSPQPVLSVHLLLSERDSHTLAAHLEGRKLVQVVSAVRALVGPAAQQALARRLERMLNRRGLPPQPGAGLRLASQLADAMVRAVSKQLPEAVPALAQAAKDPSPGVTLTFGFTFAGKQALATAAPGNPTLTIRPGHRSD